MAWDEDKYKKIFEQRYGKGSFDSGLSDARSIGRSKANAAYQKQLYQQRLKEQEKAQKAADEANKYDGIFGGTKATANASKQIDDMLKNPKKKGAYRNAEDIRNDPSLQAELKNRGFGVDKFIDAMYNAASGGQFKSERQYKQFAGQLATDTNAANKKADAKSMNEHVMNVQDWFDFNKQQQKTQSTQKKDDNGFLGLGGFFDKVKKSEMDKLDSFKKSEIGQAGKAALEFFNPFDNVSAKDAVNKYLNHKQSDTFKEVSRGANRAVDSASVGAMSNLDKKINKRDPYYTTQRKLGEGGGTDMLTSALGYLVPGAGAVKAVKGLGLGAKEAQGLAKLGQLAKEGALVGGGLSGAEVGVREALNPNDSNWKDNAKQIALGTALGGFGDPLLHGAGKLAGNTLAKFAKGDVPTYSGGPSEDALSKIEPQNPVAKLQDLIRQHSSQSEYDSMIKAAKQPKYEVPEGQRVKFDPKAAAYKDAVQQEYKDAVQQQYDYLKNSMGKGTTPGGLIQDREGYVTGAFGRVSNNPKWYQDFYKANGRKPNQAELKQLAEDHVNNGFVDEHGSIPPFAPKHIQEINDQIDEVTSMLQDHPDQEEALVPILKALEEDKAAATKEYEKAMNNDAKPKKAHTNISAAPKKKSPGTLPASELDNHGYGLIDLQAEAKVNKKKVSPALQDEVRQSQGNANTFREKINDTPKKDKKGILKNLHTQFIDDMSPLGQIEKKITGKISSAEHSLYKQARLYKGSPEKAHLIVKEQLHPLFNDMEKNKINYKDLRDYAMAVHAKDVNDKGINSGFTSKEIEDVINKFKSPKMEELRKKLVGVNDYAMKLLSTGEKPVLNPADVKALKEKWPNYMSLFRSFDDNKVDFANGISKSMANVTNPIKKLEGSDKQVIDPMESVIKNLFKAVNVSDRNKVAAQVGKLAEKDTKGNFIKKLADNEDTSRKNVISVMNNGKKEKYEVPPEVYKTMMNLDKESTNTLVKILQKPASLLRAGATLTPEFSLRNPLRDVPNAFVTSKNGFNPVTDFPVGLWQSIWKGRTIKIGNKEFKTSGELYKQFIKENGGYGNIISMDRQLHQKMLKKALTEHNKDFVDVLSPKTYKSLLKSFANPINTLRNIADVSESATKVGEFRAALRKGATPQEAAYQARDLMDFARAGVSVREANKVVAFLNANIQGKSKLFRAFKENPATFTGKAVGMVTLPTIGAIVAQNTYANEQQKSVINDAPQWLKDTFYLVPIPGTNQIARIPKPFDLAFAFSNMVERAFDFAAKHDKQAFDGFIKQGFSQASIPVMLTGISPIVEGMANYSFFKQGAIIPKREENIDYPDQYDVNTSEVAKAAGKGINKLTGGQGAFKNFGSPRVIDNTIQGFTGGSGTYVTNAVDWFLNKSGAVKNPDRPAKNIDQKPLARAFLVNQSASGDSLDKLYTLKDKLTKERGSAKQNHQPFSQEGQYKMINQATKVLSKMNTQIRTVENAPSYTAEQKRKMIDELVKQRNAYSLQVMKGLKQE